ncbi:hypothetical protein HELRODRAFT_159241 [Helobdella robusta]|uniref:Proline-rich transmembrane protein 3/4 domain-containing protein n=1 Tax=Helobdella robusta TaxID=6412 RepID=T1ENS4_HELRO|nr:hypothetical protein HELRODRAFT_159241 [Helobdella robusta]ESO12664.1 hypothetical protein HELRODRAFT_159241 [Helobdella robusta]
MPNTHGCQYWRFCSSNFRLYQNCRGLFRSQLPFNHHISTLVIPCNMIPRIMRANESTIINRSTFLSPLRDDLLPSITWNATTITTPSNDPIEPSPNWMHAFKVWGCVWDLHVYFFSISFLINFLVPVVVSARLLNSRQRQRYFRSFIAMLVSAFCLLNVAYMLIDPYHSQNVIPLLVSRLIKNINLPLVLSINVFVQKYVKLLSISCNSAGRPQNSRNLFSKFLFCKIFILLLFYLTTFILSWLDSSNSDNQHRFYHAITQIIFFTWCLIIAFNIFHDCSLLKQFSEKAFKTLHNIKFKKKQTQTSTNGSNSSECSVSRITKTKNHHPKKIHKKLKCKQENRVFYHNSENNDDEESYSESLYYAETCPQFQENQLKNSIKTLSASFNYQETDKLLHDDESVDSIQYNLKTKKKLYVSNNVWIPLKSIKTQKFSEKIGHSASTGNFEKFVTDLNGIHESRNEIESSNISKLPICLASTSSFNLSSKTQNSNMTLKETLSDSLCDDNIEKLFLNDHGYLADDDQKDFTQTNRTNQLREESAIRRLTCCDLVNLIYFCNENIIYQKADSERDENLSSDNNFSAPLGEDEVEAAKQLQKLSSSSSFSHVSLSQLRLAPALLKISKAAMFVGLSTLCFSFVHVYNIFGVFGVFSNYSSAEPWTWLLLQSINRLTEIWFISSVTCTIGLSLTSRVSRKDNSKTIRSLQRGSPIYSV